LKTVKQKEAHITVKDLTMAYGSFVLMRDLNFSINHGDIFIIMGGSGCGKSTLLRHLVGLKSPAKGDIVYGDVSPREIREVVSLKMALVGLAGFETFYPSEISGGMRKRAGLARAMALDPEILFFDEPSAGLDPVSAKRLDDLILELRDSLGATVVVVTHELASIFAIGNNSVFLDPETRTMIAVGDPNELLAESEDPKVRTFLMRGETGG
jgi:phospholipid/cholesterol/gamma-HCH transport system ATP-binding protein